MIPVFQKIYYFFYQNKIKYMLHEYRVYAAEFKTEIRFEILNSDTVHVSQR